MAALQIEERHARLLAHWASVGRTIDATVDALLEVPRNSDKEELAQNAIDELLCLKDALDACNAAAKQWLHSMPKGESK